jgi:spermidine/putrescine transport system substrate-binding protein
MSNQPRRLPQRAMDRRQFLIKSGLMGAAGLSLPAFLAACGGDDSGSSGTNAPDPTTGGSTGAGAGDTELRVLNWQSYIDETSVERFMSETGVNVTYSEDFNDNNEIFNRLWVPIVGRDEVMDWDIVCPTNWMTARLRGLDWLAPLPLDQIPNHANLEDSYLGLEWDPGAEYFMPWQSGITGIAYNPELTGRELKSVNDLFDPEFAGKVAMLTEMRDSVGLTMLGMGADPKSGDKDAALAAIEKIEQAASGGQIRQFTGNEYLRSLESGDFVACVAWSGDILQLQASRPDIQFVIPEEGGMLWFDTMVVPKGSPNGAAAAKWMNFFYDPVNAAKLTEFVQYISPVKGVREELVKLGGETAALADNPILFPDAESSARLNVFGSLDQDTDIELTDAFLKATGG